MRLCRTVTSMAKDQMEEPSRKKMDRKKFFSGVFFICLAVLLMLLGEKHTFTHSAGDLGIPVGIGLIALCLGQVFLAGRGLKTNELPDTGKDV